MRSSVLKSAAALFVASVWSQAAEAQAPVTAPAPEKPSIHAMTPGNVVQPITPREPGAGASANALFGAVRQGAPMAARAIGSYAKGCLAGGVALPVDGPAWQAMRLSRHRNWGHPKMVELVQRLAVDAKAKDGWPGLLVGDISQPRGGPMLTGHASHQIGLDADIWLTPMPDRKLTASEREEMPATSMLTPNEHDINPQAFTVKHMALLKRAASYPDVERLLVHPAIKDAICKMSAGQAEQDRAWLTKVRPIWGHFYHFHIRIGCPPGQAGCVPQKDPPGDDGCGKEVADWLKLVRRPPPATPGPGRKPMQLAQLPAECKAVLEAGR